MAMYLGSKKVSTIQESDLRGWLNKYGYCLVISKYGYKAIIIDDSEEFENSYGTTIKIIHRESKYGN